MLGRSGLVLSVSGLLGVFACQASADTYTIRGTLTNGKSFSANLDDGPGQTLTTIATDQFEELTVDSPGDVDSPIDLVSGSTVYAEVYNQRVNLILGNPPHEQTLSFPLLTFDATKSNTAIPGTFFNDTTTTPLVISTVVTGTLSPVGLPEPASLGLIGFASMGLLMRRRHATVA